MNKKLVAFFVSSLSLYGCGGNDMCKINDDCINMCRAYENNSILYACVEGNCRCVDESKLVCINVESYDKCKDICALYRPGTDPQCINNKCACVEPAEE